MFASGSSIGTSPRGLHLLRISAVYRSGQAVPVYLLERRECGDGPQVETMNETMNARVVDVASSDLEPSQTDLFQAAKDAQTGARKQLPRGQRAPWRTVIAVAACTALIFVVVKCTMRLSSERGISVRLLAGGGGGRPTEGPRADLQRASGSEGGDSCDPAGGGQKKQNGKKRPWWRFGKSKSPKGEEKGIGSGSHGAGTPSSGTTSSGERRRRRVPHKTRVPVGKGSSSHYSNIHKPYDFPLLGDGDEHKPLRRMLQQVQGRAEDMCLPHEDGFSSVGYKATYRLKDGTSATVNVTLVEVFFGSTGPPDPRFKYFYGDGQGFGHKHLGRDVGCILEEMVTQALSEAASTGVPRGETTRLMFKLPKPLGVPCAGTILFEVFVTTGSSAGLEEDDWA